MQHRLELIERITLTCTPDKAREAMFSPLLNGYHVVRGGPTMIEGKADLTHYQVVGERTVESDIKA